MAQLQQSDRIFVESPGLGQKAQIRREPSGEVHVKAESELDLFFAQGWIHARDRLWQMDYQRRIGAGRLAEIFGSAALEQDVFLRTLGLYRAAESAYLNLDLPTKTIVDAYTNGVNAYLATNAPRDPEFQALDYRPEPWKPADTLAILKSRSLYLSGNYQSELTRAGLLARGIGFDRIQEIFAYGNSKVNILQSADIARIPGLPPANPTNPNPQPLVSAAPIQASNNWVVAGSRTTTGKPFLANDPHLSLEIPSLWYLINLESPTFNAIGATFPGLPGIPIGRNQNIAWGVTNSGADVQDLYSLVETVPNEAYSYKGQSLPYGVRFETIQVKGAPSRTIKVRESVCGPIISDALGIAEPMALRWVSLDFKDSTLTSFLDVNRAANWQEFTAALKGYVAPSQNFVYADIQGNIGYYLSGQIPLRQSGHDGQLPVSGTGQFDWQGFIPFEQLPQIYNPPRGYIVTANNRIVSAEYPYFIGNEWAPGYRAQRIEEMILSKDKLSLQDMQAIQLDQVTLLYRDFQPILNNVRSVLLSSNPPGSEVISWIDSLLQWDGNLLPDSQKATIFVTWYNELTKVPAARLGNFPSPQFILQALTKGDPLFGNTATQSIETAARIFQQVVNNFNGKVPTWGEVHRVDLSHPFLPIARQVPFGGDSYTINVGGYDSTTYLMKSGPGYRQIVDLANPNNSLYVHSLGQVGQNASAWFDNLLSLWQQGKYLAMETANYLISQNFQLLGSDTQPIKSISGTAISERLEIGFTQSGVISFSGAGDDAVDTTPSLARVNIRSDGGTGNDRLIASGSDYFFGGSGNDSLSSAVGSSSNRFHGGTGEDLLVASNGSDYLFGDAGNDTLNAATSNGGNRLYGGAGEDYLVASSGDRLLGQDGNDTLFAGKSNNLLTGGTGSDRFWIANGAIPNGINTITDFKTGADLLGLAGVNMNARPLEFADLILKDSTEGVQISIGSIDPKPIVILAGVTLSQIDNPDNFVFSLEPLVI